MIRFLQQKSDTIQTPNVLQGCLEWQSQQHRNVYL